MNDITNKWIDTTDKKQEVYNLNISNIFVPVNINEEKIPESTIPSVFTERNCDTCNINRPKLTSHCSTCDNCIMNFDQWVLFLTNSHCLFVGNCIGIRNEKNFIYFLFFGTICSIHLLTICFAHFILNIIDHSTGLLSKLDEMKYYYIVSFILVFLSLFVKSKKF